MANKYGVNATKRDVNVPSDKIAPGDYSGRVRVLYDEYTFTAALATTDTLYLQKIPKGARVIEAVCMFDDLGSTGTFDIGWQAGATAAEAASSQGLFASLDVNSAADVIKMSNNAASPVGMFKEFTEEVQVVV